MPVGTLGTSKTPSSASRARRGDARRARPARIRVGTAGWSYRDWEGVFYPVPRPRGFDPLEYLARYLDLVEINSTFYRPAERGPARRWVERVADFPSFTFSAKLWRRFTHERESAFTRADVAAVRGAMRVLHEAGKLGALLLQFPWSFRRNDENRQWLDDVTSAFAEFPLVIEVRHESWAVPDFFDELTDRGIGFVNIDQPLFKHSVKPSARATAPVGYVRIHGRNYQQWFRKDAGVEARYDYLYSPSELEPWANRAKQIAEAGTTTDVFAVTNNHYRAQAAVNAIQMKGMLLDEPVPAPEPLYANYEGELGGYAYPE